MVINLSKYTPAIDMAKAKNIKNELHAVIQCNEIIVIDFNGIQAINTDAARYIFEDLKTQLGNELYRKNIIKKGLSPLVDNILMITEL